MEINTVSGYSARPINPSFKGYSIKGNKKLTMFLEEHSQKIRKLKTELGDLFCVEPHDFTVEVIKKTQNNPINIVLDMLRPKGLKGLFSKKKPTIALLDESGKIIQQEPLHSGVYPLLDTKEGKRKVYSCMYDQINHYVDFAETVNKMGLSAKSIKSL